MTWERSLLDLLSGVPARRRLAILSFHRVLSEDDPLLPTEPSATTFDRLLEAIGKLLVVVPLQEAVKRLRDGTLPARAACITFDDGYRNNHDIAAPLLEKRGMPATFFIATGAIEQGAMWNDLLIETVRASDADIDLTDAGLGVVQADASQHRRVAKLLNATRYLPLDDRAALAMRLYKRYVCDETPQLMMSPAMIRSLSDRGFDVGSHTVNHPILATLSRSDAEREIVESAVWVERVTGRRPRSFAYPNGRPGVDFGQEHCDLVRRAGFVCAVSTEWACATRFSHPFALPRFTPWETTSRGIAARLAKTYLKSYLPGRAALATPRASQDPISTTRSSLRPERGAR